MSAWKASVGAISGWPSLRRPRFMETSDGSQPSLGNRTILTRGSSDFRSFTVAHPRLVEAKEALVNAIRGAEPNSLIFVFGPTGVGKTTLRLKTEQLITAEMLSELREDRYPDSSSQCGSRSSRVRQF